MKKSAVLVISAISLLLLAACSFAEPYAPDSDSVASYAAPSLELSAPLFYSADLKNSQGQVLATYRASFPQFTCSEETAAPGRINQVYSSLLNESEADCQSFFTHCKSALGENWQETEAENPLFSAEIDFSELACPSEYICVSTEYTLTEKDITSVYPSCNIFLAETGWQLSFSSLFGENADKALSLVKAGVEAYCLEHNIPTISLSLITTEYLSGRCGMSEESLFICFDPFFFASTVKDLLQIDLPISDFIPLLTEKID